MNLTQDTQGVPKTMSVFSCTINLAFHTFWFYLGCLGSCDCWLRHFWKKELDLAFNNVKPKDWYFGLGGSAQVLLALTIDFWTLDLGLKKMYEIMRVLWEFLKGYTFIPSY